MKKNARVRKTDFADHPDIADSIKRWNLDHEMYKLVEEVTKNWLLESDWLSQEEFRARWVRYRRSFHFLQNSSFVVANARDRYRPSFLAFGILVAKSTRKLAQISETCEALFSHLKKLYLANVGHASEEIEVISKNLGRPVRLVEKALELLSDTSLGIHQGQIPDGRINVTVQEYVLHFATFWEYALHHVKTSGNFESKFHAPDIFGLQKSEPYADILAVVPDGAAHYSRCVARMYDEPDAAITSARTLVEATLKWVLHDSGRALTSNVSPAKLFSECASAVGLEPHSEDDKLGIGAITAGMDMALRGLANLRNKRSDSHARAPGQPVATRRQARLAVLLSVALSVYMVESWEASK